MDQKNRWKSRGRLLFAIALNLLVIPYFICNGENTNLDDAARKTLGGTYVELSRGKVHYEIGGPENGPVVVLVHGYSMPMFVYDRNFKSLTEAGFRVLRYDLYGRGFSARVSDVPHGKELFDGQLLELLDALKLKKPVHLMGLSMGGAVSVIFAAAHPERVRTLTLFAPAGFPIKTSPAAKVVTWPVVGSYVLTAFGDSILRGNVKKNVHDQSLVPELKKNYIKQMKYRGFKAGLRSTLRNMPIFTLAETYKEVGTHAYPVQLIWGKQDKVIPFKNAALVRGAIPRAHLHALEKIAHLPPYEAADKVNPLVIQFVRTFSGRGGRP